MIYNTFSHPLENHCTSIENITCATKYAINRLIYLQTNRPCHILLHRIEHFNLQYDNIMLLIIKKKM